MPTGRAVLAFQCIGVLKNTLAYNVCHQCDIREGFVTHGRDFPHIWPTLADPMIIVVQHDKPRSTIAKSIRHYSESHPNHVDSYNGDVDLDDEHKE